MEERLAALEARVAALESKLKQTTPTSAPLVIGTKWKDRSLWRTDLKKGMTKAEVRTLFGEPDKIEVYGAIGDVWHFGYPAGGTVRFNTRGAVDSWAEP